MLNRSRCKTLAILIALSASISNTQSAVAQKSVTGAKDHVKACELLLGSTLDRTRETAKKIPAKEIQPRIVDITKDLGRQANLQSTLACLMRVQTKK